VKQGLHDAVGVDESNIAFGFIILNCVKGVHDLGFTALLMDYKSIFGDHLRTLVRMAVDRRAPAVHAQHRVPIQMMRGHAQEDFAITCAWV